MNTNQLEEYLRLILLKNEILNLTSITDFEKAKLLHLEDSLVALPEFNKAPEGKYADLGSGGGFPGVPLSIATGREVLLVDSVAKKMKAVEEVIKELGYQNLIHFYIGRIEQLSIDYKYQFSVLTARALTNLSSLLELSAPLLKTGGQLICYKTDNEEINISESLLNKFGFQLISERHIILSDEITRRLILVYEKIHTEQIKLPRKVGIAQKRPYKS